jgi:hypothetical protein
MTVSILPKVIEAIKVQLSSEKKEPFAIDERIAQTARNQFNGNFSMNCLYSKCSSCVGVASLVGFGFSVYKFFITPVPAIGIAAASFALSQVWINTRNREGYALDHALRTKDEDEIIRQLFLGANIYQKVWPYSGAAANLFPVLKGGPRTVIQWFSEKGFSKVVAYLAMLEPNIETRKRIATDALSHAKDKKTAQLLIDLGGNVLEHSDLLFFCCLKGNLELVSFFVQNGALLDAGILDYEKWDADFDERQRQFGCNWSPGNNEGATPNLHPDFKTPLEQLLASDVSPSERIGSLANNPSIVLEALCSDPAVYKDKNSAEDLYHSLNQGGIRIRRQDTHNLFERL